MALPASGQISVSEILTELGLSSTEADTRFSSLHNGTLATINTNNAVADRPDGSAPHAMSEWFSYDHSATAPNDYYWQLTDGSNGELRWQANEGLSSANDADFSVSLWYRVDQSSKTNLLLFDLFPQGASTNANRIFLNYNASQNRFVARYRSNSTNFDRQWNLHSNSTQTGVSNSSTGWCTTQRGRVNDDNFTHLVLTYDGSQSTGAAAFKLYWNGLELTTTAASTNGTRTDMNKDEIVWSNDFNDGSGDNASFDMMLLYQTDLRSSDVTSLYNSGDPITHEDSGISATLVFQDRAETTTPEEDTGNWTLSNSNGSRQAYT